MNEEIFNKSIRAFLKKTGITGQQEIEKAVRARLESGVLNGNEKFSARMILEIPELEVKIVVEEEIRLE